MYKAYRAITRMLSFALPWYLNKRVEKGKEDPERLQERYGKTDKQRPDGKLIWVHGASVGETLSLQSLIERMLRQFPDAHVLVTSGTVTSARLMAERLSERAFHQYIPLDHPDYVSAFLDHWKPDVVLWAESDLWPNMLMEMRNRSLPAALINGRMSKKSVAKWSKMSSFARNILSSFQMCLVQNEYEAEHFIQIGAQNVNPVGNLKYSAAPLTCNEEQRQKLMDALEGRPHWFYASTHPGEEELALRIHQRLKKKFPTLVTIIAPRHPERRDEITELCIDADLKFTQRSKGEMPGESDDIHLVDTMGDMGLYFRVISLVCIGGSFIPHGGHNPIEPGRLECQILYGPHMHNFVTICEDFETASAARRMNDEEELYEEIYHLFMNPVEGQKLADTARSFTESKAHVIDEILETLYPVFDRGNLHAAA